MKISGKLLKLYLLSAIFIAISLYLDNINLFGLKTFWGFIFGIVMAIVVANLHLKEAGKRISRNHREKGFISDIGVFLVLVVFLIGFGNVPISLISVANTLFERIFVFGLLVLHICLMIFYPREMRSRFSVTSFDERGVYNKCFAAHDIFISWEECVDIGMSVVPVKGVTEYCVYFSKKTLKEKQVTRIQSVMVNDNHIWVTSSKALLEDLLQYISEDRIARYEVVKAKGEGGTKELYEKDEK